MEQIVERPEPELSDPVLQSPPGGSVQFECLGQILFKEVSE